jgi:hypothetical protein
MSQYKSLSQTAFHDLERILHSDVFDSLKQRLMLEQKQ